MPTTPRISPVDLSRRPAGAPCAVSFVVPAYAAAATLPATIASIRAAAVADSEIVVVDDSSLDDTAAVAAELADRVVVRPAQGGAARARNDGAQVAGGEVLFFVDADVTVSPEAVAGALDHLRAGRCDAVFGAYEPLPPPEVANTATTYKNLLHHHTHLRARGEAETFWSGFGAVRAAAFAAVGGFDPAVTTGADVEDIHLGYRLRAAGFRILLDPTLQVRHHKRYTVAGVIASDLFHRAVPWTRAMLEQRSFHADLNLRRSHIAAGVLAVGVPVGTVAGAWLGPPALVAAAASGALWLALHRDFLVFVHRTWGRGALRCAGLLYLYYLYGIAGTVLGAGAYALRHGRRSALNWLTLEPGDADRSELAVTVAVVAKPDEALHALESLPEPAPWWELVVVSEAERGALPEGARFLLAPAGSTRNAMRQQALEASRGEMFATLDAGCVPGPGWLDRVRQAADGPCAAVAGPFEHDRASTRRRAEHVLRYWEWRPERSGCWVTNHPSTNTAFRTAAVRQLGGFRVEGALILRLAGLGARPVRFDPAMAVQVRTPPAPGFVVGVGGMARLRASATVRYFDLGLWHRLVLVAVSPVEGALHLVRIVREAVGEGTADAQFWRALPLVAAGLVSRWVGRDLGLLRPRLRGGIVPRAHDDLSALESEPLTVA